MRTQEFEKLVSSLQKFMARHELSEGLRDKVTAFVQGQHKRLGSALLVSSVDEAALVMIVDQVLGRRDVRNWTWQATAAMRVDFEVRQYEDMMASM